MKKIFWGLLFIMLDFNLTVDNSVIGLIPDFIGWIILAIGLTEIAALSEYFNKIKPFSIGMACYSGILYFLDLVGFSASFNVFAVILGIVSVIIYFYVLYQLIEGFRELESRAGAVYYANAMHSIWIWLVVTSVLTYAGMIIPFLSILCIIASIVLGIIFLVFVGRETSSF